MSSNFNRLGKKQLDAIKWYEQTHNMKVTLSLMPTVVFINKKCIDDTNTKLINMHINVLTELYESAKRA